MATKPEPTQEEKMLAEQAKSDAAAEQALKDAAAAAAAEQALKDAAASEKKPVVTTVDQVKLRAVHGLLVHPGDETRFEPGEGTPHVMDEWCKVQKDAGKLEFAD